MHEHNGRRVTEYDIAGIFAEAYAKAATVKNAISGFEKCGIVPFRRDLFTDEDFLGADFTDSALHPGDSASFQDIEKTSAVQDSVLASQSAIMLETENALILPSESVAAKSLPTGTVSTVVSVVAEAASTSDDMANLRNVMEPSALLDSVMPSSSVAVSEAAHVVILPSDSAVAESLPTETVLSTVMSAVVVAPSMLESANNDDGAMLQPVTTITPSASIDLTITESAKTTAGKPPSSSVADVLPDVACDVHSTSFTELIPEPKQLRQPPSDARKRKVAHAEVITTSPYKSELKRKKAESVGSTRRKVTKPVTKKTLINEMKDESKESQKKNRRMKAGEEKIEEAKCKRGNKKKTGGNKRNGDDDTPCLYCKGIYRESIEGWIQCSGHCKLWAHNSCVGVDDHGPAVFVCELCK